MFCVLAAMYSLDRMSDEDEVRPQRQGAGGGPPSQITSSQLAAALMATGPSVPVRVTWSVARATPRASSYLCHCFSYRKFLCSVVTPYQFVVVLKHMY